MQSDLVVAAIVIAAVHVYFRIAHTSNTFLVECTRWILFWIMADHLISRGDENQSSNNKQKWPQLQNSHEHEHIIFMKSMGVRFSLTSSHVYQFIDASRETYKNNNNNHSIW